MAYLHDTTALSAQMSTYYEKVFLARAEYEMIFEQGAQKRTHANNEGKTVVFSRFAPLSVITASLTEGSNPTEVSLTGANVSVTLAEYGNTIKMSKFLTLTSIDVNNREKISVLGQNMGESLDQLVRTELLNGTTAYANAKAAVTDFASTDTLDAADIIKAVTTLETNKAMKYSDGFFMGKVGPAVKARILADSTWVNSKTYSDVKQLYKGEMGELYGVRFVMSANPYTATVNSIATSQHSFIHGDQAFGVYDLAGDKPRLMINNGTDSNNPTGRYSLASWVGSYAVKVLNADWIIKMISAV